MAFDKPKFVVTVLATLGLGGLSSQAAVIDSNIFINEFHYDNTGADTGEFVEIVVPSSANLTGLTLTLYNGASTSTTDDAYATYTSFTAGDTVGDFKIYTVLTPGIQNGAPDGLALSQGSTVYQFISYEGSFTAQGGPANGLVSTNIGVDEDPAPAAGNSLQLTGSGNSYSDFTWTGPTDDTPGKLNVGQSFTAVPEPGALALLGTCGLLALRRRRR